MAIADAMATNGMKEAGYEYINMDGEYCQMNHVYVHCHNKRLLG